MFQITTLLTPFYHPHFCASTIQSTSHQPLSQRATQYLPPSSLNITSSSSPPVPPPKPRTPHSIVAFLLGHGGRAQAAGALARRRRAADRDRARAAASGHTSQTRARRAQAAQALRDRAPVARAQEGNRAEIRRWQLNGGKLVRPVDEWVAHTRQ